jgi:hypothetical protein
MNPIRKIGLITFSTEILSVLSAKITLLRGIAPFAIHILSTKEYAARKVMPSKKKNTGLRQMSG